MKKNKKYTSSEIMSTLKDLNKLEIVKEEYQKGLINHFKIPLEDMIEKISNDDKFYDDITKYTRDCFEKHKLHDSELFELADLLYDQGYNLLEWSKKRNSNDPMIVNSLLWKYVWDSLVLSREILISKDVQNEQIKKLQMQLKRNEVDTLRNEIHKLKFKNDELTFEIGDIGTRVVDLKSELEKENEELVR